MTYELVHTSAPSGLRPGDRGFTTVAMTDGTPGPLVRELEARSTYDLRVAGGQAAPPFHGYARVRVAGSEWLILTRVVPSGLDYTKRPNRLAHHLACSLGDVPPDSNPAAILANAAAFRDAWTDAPHRLPPRPLPAADDRDGAGAAAWTAATGDPAWAAEMARRLQGGDAGRGIGGGLLVLHDPNLDPLGLVRGVLEQLPPAERWRVPFATDARQQALSRGSRLRLAPAGTIDPASVRGLDVIELSSLRGRPAPSPPAAAAAPAAAAESSRRSPSAAAPAPADAGRGTAGAAASAAPAPVFKPGEGPAIAIVTDESDDRRMTPVVVGAVAAAAVLALLGGLLLLGGDGGGAGREVPRPEADEVATALPEDTTPEPGRGSGDPATARRTAPGAGLGGPNGGTGASAPPSDTPLPDQDESATSGGDAGGTVGKGTAAEAGAKQSQHDDGGQANDTLNGAEPGGENEGSRDDGDAEPVDPDVGGDRSDAPDETEHGGDHSGVRDGDRDDGAAERPGDAEAPRSGGAPDAERSADAAEPPSPDSESEADAPDPRAPTDRRAGPTAMETVFFGHLDLDGKDSPQFDLSRLGSELSLDPCGERSDIQFADDSGPRELVEERKAGAKLIIRILEDPLRIDVSGRSLRDDEHACVKVRGERGWLLAHLNRPRLSTRQERTAQDEFRGGNKVLYWRNIQLDEKMLLSHSDGWTRHGTTWRRRAFNGIGWTVLEREEDDLVLRVERAADADKRISDLEAARDDGEDVSQQTVVRVKEADRQLKSDPSKLLDRLANGQYRLDPIDVYDADGSLRYILEMRSIGS